MICIAFARFPLAKVPLSIAAIQLYRGDHVVIQVLIQQPVGKWFLYIFLYMRDNKLSFFIHLPEFLKEKIQIKRFLLSLQIHI